MGLNIASSKVRVLAGVFFAFLLTGTVWAQNGSFTGTVKDATGAVIPDATVTVKHVETGLTRTAQTDSSGNFTIPAVPIGQYDVTAEKSGFKEVIRHGVTLAVAQQAVVNFSLEVGNVEQQVTVTAEAPLVNTTTASTSGVVNEEQVKDLPLNGRSFDQLITLTVQTNNYTSNDARNAFSVSGKRPETNRFLINGVDFVGADSTGQHVLPYGSSGSVLGVDAVREFNVLADAYGAEYGKRAGGQISVVTMSGTNQLHGDAFEFLRNTDLDAENFFFVPAPGVTPTILKRNQFGGALGGPIKKDKLFIFGSYEGFRQKQTTPTAANIPDVAAYSLSELPVGPGNSLQYVGPAGTTSAANNPMLPLIQIAWPNPATYPGGCQEAMPTPGVPSGVCRIVLSTLVGVREDFANLRTDYDINSNNTLSFNYFYDNGLTRSEGTVPLSGSESPLRSQVISLQEVAILSPTILNTLTLGFTRAFASSGSAPYELWNGPTPPIPSLAYFITGPNQAPGTITVGGGVAGAGIGNSTLTGGLSSSGRLIVDARNLYTISDDVHVTRGNHSLTFGVWLQPNQQNLSGTPTSNNGGATFNSEQLLFQGTVGTFIATPVVTPASYRSFEAAAYVQDDFKMRHNLNIRVGLREESTNGWNEPFGRISNFGFTNGVINTNPTVSSSAFTQNNAKDLWSPRVGVAWDPTGDGKWSVRAGAGIYYDLLDNLAHRLSATPPFNARLTFTNTPFLSLVPISSLAPVPPSCTTTPPTLVGCAVYQPAGVQPNAKTPTIQQWNFSIEHSLAKNLVLHVGYTGLEGFHMVTLMDMNQPVPAICNNAAGCRSGGVNTSGAGVGTVPVGTSYLPQSLNPATGAADGCRPNCDLADTQNWFYQGTSSYNALNVYLQQRFSSGLTFRVNYTWSKILDDNSALLGSEGSNEPQDVYSEYNLGLNKGRASYNIADQFNFNYSYELPFGAGRKFLSGAHGVEDAIIGGWQWNGIFNLQTGFPFTPEAGFDVTGAGDSHGVDLPNINPNYSGSLYNVNNTTHYFNAAAFSLPLPGTFGNAPRGGFTGPGLWDMDMSLFKSFKVMESRHLEFRAEAFNLFNHPNFSFPSPNVFTASGGISPTYGQLTKLNGAMRQIQFALKFIF